MTSHIRSWKERQLKELTGLFDSYPVVAVADIEGFPASMFALVRKKLAGKAIVKVSKTNVMKLALVNSKIKGKGLEGHISKSCAVLFTKDNPFELYAFLKKNKGYVPAKAGMIAPEDIVVPAGDTGLPPGPALSDLKQAGLNVRPMGATIHITEDKVVAKAGEEVKKAVAGTLLKMGIKPIRVGLKVVAAYEKGEIFLPEVLDIDVDKVYSDFVAAAGDSFRLAVGIGYATPATMPVLLRKAAAESFALAVEAGIYAKETIELFVSKANAQAGALKSRVKDVAPAEEKAEGPAKEEAPAEEAKEGKPEGKPAEEKKEAPDAEEKPEEKAEEKLAEEKPAETDAKPEEKSEGEEEKKEEK